MDTSDNLSIHHAVKSGDLEATELLLQEGVAICVQNKNGLTPRQILIQKKMELFDALLAKKNEEFSNFSLTAKERKELEEFDAIKERHPRDYLYCHREWDKENQKEFNKQKENSLNAIRQKIDVNDKFIDMLLKYRRFDKCEKGIQLLNFHLACTLKNSSLADKLSDQIGNIDESLSEDTSFYPGYTALHFAAHCNADTVKMLVKKGANLLNPDAKGVTSLDTCIKSFSIKKLLSILSLISAWRNLLFSDGSTKLMDYLSSLRHPKKHKDFIQQLNIGATLPKQSAFWPGYTMLHIAVILLPNSSCEKLIGILTVHSDVVTRQGSDGSTPVHLAFRQSKLGALTLLLSSQKKAVNPLDGDKLSHLHIASSLNDKKVAKIMLKGEINVTVAYEGQPLPTVKAGWSPLHTAVYTSHAIMARLLLQRGASLMQTDARGFTAVHLLPNTIHKSMLKKLSEVLFAPEHKLEECAVEGVGQLTHLHVATWTGRTEGMSRLINSKSDVEATIGKLEEGELKKFEGWRPIHLAMLDSSKSGAFSTLLKGGADVFAKSPEGSSPLRGILTGRYNSGYLTSFADFLWGSETLRIRMMEELGITMLHVACYALDKEKIRDLLERKVDVNARTRDDSSIWPGFTPLHVLAYAGLSMQLDKSSQEAIDDLCKLLLEKEADVTLADAAGDTPAFMASKARYTENGYLRAGFLMKHQRDFLVNPENKAGMSHFHLACLLSEVETVKKFLEHGQVDVNRAVNSTAKGYQYAGHTPLHLALSSPRAKKYFNANTQVQMVDLLLEFGADVHAVDAIGYTPLHKLASCDSNRNLLLTKILIDDKNINKRGTDDDKTALEILLYNRASFAEVKYFIEKGARINTHNSISDVGYMGIVLKNYFSSGTFEMMMRLPDIAEVSATGRNAIHDAVAIDRTNTFSSTYKHLFGKLMDLGCDIFQQDIKGRTALHLAVHFQNDQGIEALLKCGADVNIVDLAGKSPFSYASEFRASKRLGSKQDTNESVRKTLTAHLIKLRLVGMQVSDSNEKLLKAVLDKNKDIADIDSLKTIIKRQLQDAAKIEMCKRGFTFRDFLRKTGVVNNYSTLTRADRDSVDSFFKPTYSLDLSYLEGLLRLQYRNAVDRSSLIAPAVEGLRRLCGFPLPDLCAEVIIMHLTNWDLKNITMATAITQENQTMDVD